MRLFPRLPVVLFLFASSLSLAAAPPVLSLSSTGATIRTTPGGTVVLVGASLERRDTFEESRQFAKLLHDSDNDGELTFTMDGDAPLPLRSVWFAIDYASGERTTAMLDGFHAAELEVTPGASDGYRLRAFRGFAVLVRPTEGVWSLLQHDTTDSDGGANGRVSVALSAAKHLVDGTPAPARVASGDVVVFINTDTLDYLSTVVAR